MPEQLTIIVPEHHHDDPTCPHCGEPLGDWLAGIYVESDPAACGGEHRCGQCEGPLYVSVFRPSPVFAVTARGAGENVTWLAGERRRRAPR
jgi:hypothetical protein